MELEVSVVKVRGLATTAFLSLVPFRVLTPVPSLDQLAGLETILRCLGFDPNPLLW